MNTPILTLIVGILLGVGWTLVWKNRGSMTAEREYSEISQLARASGWLRMAIIPYSIDIRAYGLSADCETIETTITADDSASQKAALREIAATQKFQLASGGRNSGESSSADEFIHREGTLQLSCETIKTIQTAAQDGDDQSQRVLTAVKHVLDTYAPEAATVVEVQ